jgi:hypothetical protein
MTINRFTRSILLIILLFSLSKITNAQWGIRAGTTISNFYYTDQGNQPDWTYEIDLRPYLSYDVQWVQLSEQKPVFSPYLSVYRRFPLSSRVAFRPELSFCQKGVSFNQFEYERIIYRVLISYIEIPCSFSWQAIQKENFIGEFSLGAYGALKVSAFKKVAVHEDSPERTRLKSEKDMDWGMQLGFDAKRKLWDEWFLLGVHLFLGLNDLLYLPDDWTNIYFKTQKTHITGFHLSLGYEL